jgi:hypothetical protein
MRQRHIRRRCSDTRRHAPTPRRQPRTSAPIADARRHTLATICPMQRRCRFATFRLPPPPARVFAITLPEITPLSLIRFRHHIFSAISIFHWFLRFDFMPIRAIIFRRHARFHAIFAAAIFFSHPGFSPFSDRGFLSLPVERFCLRR